MLVRTDKKVKVLILKVAGINCDYETKSAFELCGAIVDCISVNCIIKKKNKIFEYDILVFPGGFSYGDSISSGKILSNELKNKLGDEIQKYALSGRPIIGICNGFQVLIKLGLLPDPHVFKQTSTISYNDSNKFECRWVYLKVEKNNGESNCIWTKGLPDIITLPIAHREGKFIPCNDDFLSKLNKNNQIVFRYSSKNGSSAPKYPLLPNGSIEHIASICNRDGNIFGLMPHPERYIFFLQHPTRERIDSNKYGWGKIIFQNAIDFVG